MGFGLRVYRNCRGFVSGVLGVLGGFWGALPSFVFAFAEIWGGFAGFGGVWGVWKGFEAGWGLGVWGGLGVFGGVWGGLGGFGAFRGFWRGFRGHCETLNPNPQQALSPKP